MNAKRFTHLTIDRHPIIDRNFLKLEKLPEWGIGHCKFRFISSTSPPFKQLEQTVKSVHIQAKRGNTPNNPAPSRAIQVRTYPKNDRGGYSNFLFLKPHIPDLKVCR